MEGNIIQIIRDYNIDPKNGKFQYKDMETVKKHFLMLLKIEVLFFYNCIYLFMIVYAVSGCSERRLLLQSTGSRLSVEWLWCTGLVAFQYVESSWNRVQTCISCIGRWILIHCTTREVLPYFISELFIDSV